LAAFLPPPLEMGNWKQDTVCAYDGTRQFKCRTCQEKYFLRAGQPFDEKLFEDDMDYYRF
jgi:hypothetical protein